MAIQIAPALRRKLMDIAIEAVVSEKTGFASHQNSVPLLRELSISNQGGSDFSDLVLEMSADLPFLEAKVWRLDRLARGDTLRISDRDIKLSPSFLNDVVESVVASITIRIVHAGVVLKAVTYPVEILAKNQWGGVGSMPDLLAAFVMPNDPAVDRVLKATSDVLRRAGKRGAIDGYESRSRTRTWELVSAIWSAVCGLHLSYALPPASFENQGQKIRTPSIALDGGVATCLDTALLFAAAIEQAGLNSLVILTKGHAFVGAWLQPQEFSSLLTDDASSVRKRVELKEMVVFETTLATQAPVPSFSVAIEHGIRQVTDEDFIMAIDICRARMQRIRPLALATVRAGVGPTSGAEPAIALDALEAAPMLPGFDVEISFEPDTPAGKLELWQRKLLDLTTRNRLLHVPESAKAIRLICPEPALLEDRLAEGKRIRIVSMPDLEAGGRDSALYEQQNRENLRDEYARSALDRSEVLATLEKSKLEVALVDMYRKARSDLDEGGANTLFLALGFLKWKKSADDPKTYSAPLILIPVKLERKSALSGVVMTMLDDEPRFNLTLLELLRHDFELTIPGLSGDLPSDESGIDVASIWNMVRRAVRDVPGFEVTPDLVLGTFSFSKYLMWKDLSDRSAQLLDSPMVRHLLNGRNGESGFKSPGEFPRPETLDHAVDPSQLFMPLPADSSQVAAVVASASGHSFVLDGPPGTGKSQTIANMIAHNLALGRRVLFVAEKMAALDVVKRRLEERGLGEFCLELHSSKASKVDVLRQLERAWDTRDALSPEEWGAEAAKVKVLRDRLNGLVRVLHRRWPNGLTVHHAIGRAVRDVTPATPKLSWPATTQHDAEHLARLRSVAHRLDLNRAAISHSSDFALVKQADWSNGWQDSLVASARALVETIDTCRADIRRTVEVTELPLEGNEQGGISLLIAFTRLLAGAYGVDLRFVFSPSFNTRQASVQHAIQLIRTYKDAERTLSLRYAAEAVRRIDIQGIELKWKEAGQKFWFLASLARKRVSKALAVVAGVTAAPDVAGDIPKLHIMCKALNEIDAVQGEMREMPGWSGLSTDIAKLTAGLELGAGIRSSLAALAKSPEHLVELRKAAGSLLVDGNEMLGSDGGVIGASNHLKSTFEKFKEELGKFAAVSGSDLDTNADLGALQAACRTIIAQERQLKTWCDWCRVRDEAVNFGLRPIVELMGLGAPASESAADMFEAAYSRWFASGAIDAEPLLRGFVASEHMSEIEAYRRIDDQVSKLTVRYIRSRLSGVIPAKNDVPKSGGYGILKHELQKSRRHKPVRQLAVEMGDALAKLAPCMLMSPLSIAQYLPADQALFDLVIFDEASQITPWDAIGSIARGKQVVIAGDPKQMPPTSFFNRAASAGDDDTEEDLESILDECLGAGVPRHRLTWHYRSRHESLIAFSNHQYYEQELITFPAAETRPSAVEWRRVDGVYAQGKGRNNQREAEAIVAETVRRLTDSSFVASGQSIGIITLNTDQQKLINDLLDVARQKHPEIEPHFQQELAEPVVVKNLETVQGDERDVIILGIGFGPTEPGARAMSMNFGPLNKEGGWRRLNVAVTRARREMLLFTSFDASMVDLNRTSAKAVRDLKHFIEFAQHGPRALAEAVHGSVGSYDSPFEQYVAEGLRAKGWVVVPQIGVSRFRIDLGVVHPDRPGDYLVGVECDGATYHSAATARDRDKVRSGILQGLGWKLLRVWSTEWWIDREGALGRLHVAIVDMLTKSRLELEAARVAEDGIRGGEGSELTVAPNPDIRDVSPSSVGVMLTTGQDAPETVTPLVDEIRFASAQGGRLSEPRRASYVQADVEVLSVTLNPDKFYVAEYDEILLSLIHQVLQREAPILDALLVQRVARAHGFQRAGRLIRERVLELAEQHHHIDADPIDGKFVWLDLESIGSWNTYREPAGGDVRSIEEISIQELRSAARSVSSGDRGAEVARIFGVKRLSAQSKQRIERALAEEPQTMS
jgi:very-short-patch-repair endonuclease